jgi:hypothetical protein
MEAEYNAVSMSMREVLPLKRLVEAVTKGVGLSEEQERRTTFKTTVWEDNSGTLTLANLEPGRMTPRSKHYAIKSHWFRHRQHLRPNKVEVKKISTDETTKRPTSSQKDWALLSSFSRSDSFFQDGITMAKD